MNATTEFDFDVIIVGAGMVGASLAHALRPTGLRVCLVEAVPPRSDHQPSYDDRSLALSLSSRQILAALHQWHDIAPQATPIRHIHVSDQYRPGMVRLHAKEMGVDALGYVVLARDLGQVLLKELHSAVADFRCPAAVTAIDNQPDRVTVTITSDAGEDRLTSQLLVLADGSRSRTRAMCRFEQTGKSYGQTAIVSNVMTELHHHNTAFERFTTHGPIAFLPTRGDRMAMVFTVASDRAEDYLALTDTAFTAEIQAQFGRRLGRISKPGKRVSYDIALQHVERQYQNRVLLLGNSAHTLHPNAAQGFNLALRDVAGLAEVLADTAACQGDPGDEPTMERYMALRGPDQQRVLRFTDGLARSFYTSNPLMTLARNAGLMATGLLPPLRRHVMQQGAGITGRMHHLPG